LVKTLLDPRLRADVEQGSSFAVTVDNWNGTWNLWLSEVSYNFLLEGNYFVEADRLAYPQPRSEDVQPEVQETEEVSRRDLGTS
jgi:hypothetical protein